MIYNIGKIICLAIIGACALAFIFYLVDFIILPVIDTLGISKKSSND